MASRIRPLPAAEAATGKELHDREGQAIVFADVAYLDDVRVRQLHQGADLTSKAANEPGVLQHGAARHLDHHVAVEAEVARTVDEPHTAFAKLGDDAVAAVGEDKANPTSALLD